MKCPRCGYETVHDAESLAGSVLHYLLIALFGAGLVGAGCLIILEYAK